MAEDNVVTRQSSSIVDVKKSTYSQTQCCVFVSHYSFLCNPFLLTREINIPEAKAAAGKKCDELQKLPAWKEKTV